MNKIDKVFKELSSLYELNKIINTYQIQEFPQKFMD